MWCDTSGGDYQRYRRELGAVKAILRWSSPAASIIRLPGVIINPHPLKILWMVAR
jgi:hypothetical protein